MSIHPIISAYTPSNTDPEILSTIFVQREKLLDRVVNRLSRSMESGDKHHILLIGTRGSGKTHFVSLVESHLQNREELNDVMRIAWLGEDDSFTGLVHLAFGIAKTLSVEYPDEFPQDFKTAVHGLPPDDAALAVLNAIIDQLDGRNLLLITENMDQTFRGLGDSGQKKWRAFLQETCKIATLATSQQLFSGVSDRNETFFGFFDIQHLAPLSVTEAHELIKRISVQQQKPELVSFLDSAEGRFRIRALHYLAGGNHRMYVMLSEFLTKESLDDLVASFESLAHDMTPYFQELMRSLSPQQRQIVQCLCEHAGALVVKKIAEETFVEERSCSKQLGILKTMGYVRSEKRGKESHYDIADPFIRICLENNRLSGHRLRLTAMFLRAWFPAQTLNTQQDNIPQSTTEKYRQNIDNVMNSIAETSAMFESPETSLEQRALELYESGYKNWRLNKHEQCTADFQKVLSIQGISKHLLNLTLFSVAGSMLEHCHYKIALDKLNTALFASDRNLSNYGGAPHEYLHAVLRRSPNDWSSYIAPITDLYIQYEVADKLGQGITQSVQYIDGGGFSHSQIRTWNSLWQAAGDGCDDLQIPLQCLNAGVDVICSNPTTDKPLFRLPLEVRTLVRPLLNQSLGGQ